MWVLLRFKALTLETSRHEGPILRPWGDTGQDGSFGQTYQWGRTKDEVQGWNTKYIKILVISSDQAKKQDNDELLTASTGQNQLDGFSNLPRQGPRVSFSNPTPRLGVESETLLARCNSQKGIPGPVAEKGISSIQQNSRTSINYANPKICTTSHMQKLSSSQPKNDRGSETESWKGRRIQRLE